MDKTKGEKRASWTLHHVGVVVKDLDKAIEYFLSLGIGPFVSNPSAVATDRKVYGKPADIKLRGAEAQLGPIKFELIQPVSGESVQKEFLETKGEGMNHIGFMVVDLDKEVKKLGERGFHPISTGKIPPKGGFAYMGTNRVGGVVIELIKKGSH